MRISHSFLVTTTSLFLLWLPLIVLITTWEPRVAGAEEIDIPASQSSNEDLLGILLAAQSYRAEDAGVTVTGQVRGGLYYRSHDNYDPFDCFLMESHQKDKTPRKKGELPTGDWLIGLPQAGGVKLDTRG